MNDLKKRNALWVGMFAAVVLTGCGGSSNGDGELSEERGGSLEPEMPAPDPQPEPGPDPGVQSISEVIVYLKATGDLPELDKSDALTGEDLDQDGIRDDIAFYIDSQASSPEMREALRSLSAGIQSVMATPELELYGDGAKTLAASYLPDHFCAIRNSDDKEELLRLSDQLSMFMLNTPDRAGQFQTYMLQLDARVINASLRDCDAEVGIAETRSDGAGQVSVLDYQPSNVCSAGESARHALGYINSVATTPNRAMAELEATVSLMEERGINLETTNFEPALFYQRTADQIFSHDLMFSTDAAVAGFSEDYAVMAEEYSLIESLFYVSTVNGVKTVWEDFDLGDFGEFLASYSLEKISQYADDTLGYSSGGIGDWFAKVDEWGKERRRVLMLAHGTGNDRASALYAMIDQVYRTDQSSTNYVQTAPININETTDQYNQELFAPYISSNADLVLAGANSLNGGISPEPNEFPTTNPDDVTGHDYISSYLNPDLTVLTEVGNSVVSQHLKTVAPITSPYFSIELRWTYPGDLELTVEEPDGSVFGGDGGTDETIITSNGQLDKIPQDRDSGVQKEIYRANCYSDTIAKGNYFFTWKNPSIIVPDGETASYTVTARNHLGEIVGEHTSEIIEPNGIGLGAANVRVIADDPRIVSF